MTAGSRPVIAIAALALGPVCAMSLLLLGLDEASDLGLERRFLYWWSHVLPALLMLAAVQRLARRLGASRPAAVLIAVSATIVPFSLLSGALDVAFELDRWATAGFAPWLVEEISDVLPRLAVLWALLVVAAPALRSSVREEAAPDAGLSPETPPSPAWPESLDAVPASGRGRLLWIRSDQHYLEVHSDTGVSFVRGVLRSVVDELGAERGLLVHRSSWVAYDAIDDLVGRASEPACRLENGDRVRVSRRRLAAVRDALAAHRARTSPAAR